jgi:tetratricopeptide (TPR) repeat protein
MELSVALLEFAVSGCAGAIGGLVASINAPTNNTIRLTGISRAKADRLSGKHVDLGFVGDLIVGGAAGIAIVFFSNIAVTNNAPANSAPGNNAPSQSIDYLKLIPLGLMAGVVGKRALPRMSEAVMDKLVSETESLKEQHSRLEDHVKTLDHINELIQEGERYLIEGDEEKQDNSKRAGKYESARDTFLKAIELDHGHSVAYVCLGKAMKRLATGTSDREEKTKLIEEAIDATSEAIKLNPTYDRAYYNRACYRSLNRKTADALNDLEKAIRLFPLNRLYAKSDPDFEALQRDERFQFLVESGGKAQTAGHGGS